MTADPAFAAADEVRQLRMLLAQREAERAASATELDDFLRAVSHDLRAPLRHVGAFGQLLAERVQELGGDAEATEYLQTILKSGRHLSAMVDGLLALSQIARAPLDPQPLPLAALLEEARARCLADGATTGRRIEWRIPAQLPDCVGDAVLIRQLLEHVLSNAIKFSRPRPVAVITVRATATAEQGFELLVHDDGVGFDPARAAKLFGVFERLHPASEFEGLGVGLAAARRIARRHGGDLWLEAHPDGGCTARLRLPAFAIV